MKRITLELPDSIDLSDFDLKMILACQLYHQAKLSSGQAAGLVGLSKREFLELMGKYGYSIFSDSIEDLRKDIAHA
jgi:predicted HTH domain antitoxin